MSVEKMPINIWLRELSLFSALGVFEFILERSVSIYFLKPVRGTKYIIRLLQIFRPLWRVEVLSEDSFELKSDLNHWHHCYLATEYCEIIKRELERERVFGEFENLFSKNKLKLFINTFCVDSFMDYFILLKFCLGRLSSGDRNIFIFPYSPLSYHFGLFLESLKLEGKRYRALFRADKNEIYKFYFYRIVSAFKKTKTFEKKKRIAIHYGTGLSPERWNSIYWTNGNKFDFNEGNIFIKLQTSYSDSAEKFSKEDTKKFPFNTVFIHKFGKLRDSRIFYPKRNKWELIDQLKRFSFKDSSLPNMRALSYIRKLLVFELQYWLDFYCATGTTIQAESGNWSTELCAQSMALRELGGVMFGCKRSENCHGFYQLYDYLCPYDIFFHWGERYLEYIKFKDSAVTKRIVCGYPFDYLFTKEIKDLSFIATKEFCQSEKTKILFLDNVVMKTGPYLESKVKAFYSELFNFVDSNSKFQLIVKPKKNSGYFDFLERETLELLKKIEKEKKCFVVSKSQYLLSASFATLVDISVGLGISSSISEIVISGGKGIHFDITKNREHPFYSYPVESGVISNSQKLFNAFESIHTEKKSEIADWSHVVNRLDPFRDGLSAKRIGNFVKEWIKQDVDKFKVIESIERSKKAILEL